MTVKQAVNKVKNMMDKLMLECFRCGHKWFPRKLTRRICPKCKSPYWDRPKENS